MPGGRSYAVNRSGDRELGPEFCDLPGERRLVLRGDANIFLFDTVERTRMDSWPRGRVVLVGDSA
jgi:2-polyprenyl-6-methoxyphenol hydroxylase-like FAD-dependent oxidoreductase